MEIVSVAEAPIPTRRQHQCSVCGEWDRWTEEHRWIERLVKDEYYGYEITFIVCSKECHEKAKEPFVNWLKKYRGWNKKKAEDNWDQFIKNSYGS